MWWVAAEESASVPDQFAALAARLGLDPAADPEGLQALVHDRLRSVAGWLLIFDNADRAQDIRSWLPTGPMPPGIPGHVIVTTWRGGFAAMGQVLDLDVIGLADAVRMLRARVPDLGQQTGEQIAEELGRLPLALEQAAAWLDRSQMPGTEYLELLRSRGAELYARGEVSDRNDTIATLWEISVGRITNEDPAAVQLLFPGAVRRKPTLTSRLSTTLLAAGPPGERPCSVPLRARPGKGAGYWQSLTDSTVRPVNSREACHGLP